MQYAHLGRTGLQVSRLGLGTLAFGWKTSEAESFAIMDQALELGINLIDTANVYGEPQPPADARGEGIAEQIIGRWLAQGGRRERIVLATKVYQAAAATRDRAGGHPGLPRLRPGPAPLETDGRRAPGRRTDERVRTTS
jgi:aryl-alcohol dehydrogenase-like predicted oxidoreductase